MLPEHTYTIDMCEHMFYSHYIDYTKGGVNMLDWICKKLEDKAVEKQHEVIKLQWQKAKLQQLLDQKKREQEHGQSKTE